MSPDQELNRHPLGARSDAQPTEPHQPGQEHIFKMLNLFGKFHDDNELLHPLTEKMLNDERTLRTVKLLNILIFNQSRLHPNALGKYRHD